MLYKAKSSQQLKRCSGQYR